MSKIRSSCKDLEFQARLDVDNLTLKINSTLSNPKNWVIFDIKKENDEVKEVKLKPLDVAPYCKYVFDRFFKTLVMNATILSSNAYCRSVGLNVGDVELIQVQSDSPIQNRLIHPLNIAYLNHENLQLQETKSSIIKAVYSILTIHRNDKRIFILHSTNN